ncbi:uncharacterized protein VP01_6895g1 [Puccinia sorghi]|uniref:CCHC-type domain-containing protein n=1 Tax=Puccinia sorghi TaxID=27349 RepID=A0A0L6UE94_9BASI|nr:uncharacterized protein VP01_6895g1 [Puccinia sorghi]
MSTIWCITCCGLSHHVIIYIVRLELCRPTLRTSTHTPTHYILFTSLQEMQAMALKSGQTIEGIQTSHSNTPTTANAINLSAFQCGPHNQLSNAKHACRAQLNLCFRCGQAEHISHGCSNRKKNLEGRQQSFSSARISELQAKINRILSHVELLGSASNQMLLKKHALFDQKSTYPL